MKKVYTNPSIVPCDMLKGIMEGERISCTLRNEPIGTVGLGDPVPWCPSLNFAWPEVWVNDEDYEQALPLAEEFQQVWKATSEEADHPTAAPS